MYPNKYVSTLINDAINKEYETADFYRILSENITDIEDKKLLADMSMDEEKHAKILTELYTVLNSESPVINKSEISVDDNAANNISNSIIDETKTIEYYRALLFALLPQQHRDMLTEIIFDEQNHTAKLNYLYSKNK